MTMTKTLQRHRVLDYIRETGSITQLEAIKELGVLRLSAVIFDLKKEGHAIKSELVPVKTRYGVAHVARYSEVKNDGSC
jgi:hypothetical protein